MKEIFHNYDNLEKEEITETVTRIKALLINNDNILIGYSDNVYHFPGGHLEENEEYKECLKREIKEECGIDISISEIGEPIMKATSYYRDWPHEGVNGESLIYYYVVNTNEYPDISKINLTEQEKQGNFEIRVIPIEDSIAELNNNIINNERNKHIAPDMIEAIKEYKKLKGVENGKIERVELENSKRRY